jgi:hypothetical protein
MLTFGWLSRRLFIRLLGALLLVALASVVAQYAARRSDVYKLAVATAHQTPQFTAALGAPVTEAWFSEGTTTFGSAAKAEVLIPVQGRMRRGSLRARAIKGVGGWQLTELTLELIQPDEHIDLLSRPPI